MNAVFKNDFIVITRGQGAKILILPKPSKQNASVSKKKKKSSTWNLKSRFVLLKCKNK